MSLQRCCSQAHCNGKHSDHYSFPSQLQEGLCAEGLLPGWKPPFFALRPSYHYCSQGSGVQFATRFPAELEGKIDRSLFDYTISTLNSLYAEAEKGSCST